MKMNYELKSSIHKNKISWPIKIVAGIVFILVILHFILPTLLSTVLLSIISPFWSISSSERPNLNLLSENVKDQIIYQLKNENIELKSILNRKISDNIVLAYILKKPPFTAYDSYIIDIGSDEGVEKGDKVYVYGDIVVGEIDEVFENVSKVRLYSTFGEKYDVLIGKDNIQATAIGRGGGTFEIIIPRDIKVVEGDTIVIPDISSTIFGIVGDVITEPARAFSTIIFSQPINIYEQKWVQVYEKSKSN